jgi:hypothetical protein
LREFEIHVPDNSLTGLLQQLKGAKVQVHKTSRETITGSILGTQNFEANAYSEPHLSLLIDGKDLITLSMNEVVNVDFLDEHLKKDLQHLLQGKH